MALLRQKCIVGRKIQETSYGSVLQCKLLHNADGSRWNGGDDSSKVDVASLPGEIVAVKVMDSDAVSNRIDRRTGNRVSEDPFRELIALRELAGHPNIVKLIDEFQDNDRDVPLFVVILEFCDADLFTVIKRYPQGLPMDFLKSAVSGLFSGVEAIFRAGFVHRDLSVENILIKGGVIKICDFGLALRWPKNNHTSQSNSQTSSTSSENAFASASSSSSSSSLEMSMDTENNGGRNTESEFERVGKIIYMSPELLACTIQDWRPSDVYAAGVILFILLCGFPPCDVAHESDTSGGFLYMQAGKLKELITRYSVIQRVPSELFPLLEGLLRVDPKKRVTITQVLDYLGVVGWKI